ncbi:VOC family protein [Nocardioides jishulii]|uniref:VOC domain-containing protein n=1 Tax=Nocardioides jishulii TaxID=2575440 RepID=A0A4U2YMI7_9ACTN|nr:hypothetical protein [Nocardioides jishulii]QCX27640.1 hypothetical protein FCL41_08980 [Nocardioides jishulii]TKI62447.1 hypothetical protein FC770_08645 [Nocardioides jishulii]
MYGPLVSTGDAAPHTRLYCDVFGMEESGAARLPEDVTRTLFGADAGAVELRTLRTPGVLAGTVLCLFEPGSDEQIRTAETRLHRDAFRVIDFYAPDLDAAVAHARELGYHVEHSEAGYDLDEGAFREAHLPGPDGVVTAFLSGPRDFFTGFAQVRDRIVSEVCSISAPLGAVGQPSIDFYREVLGWGVVFEYAFEDDSFSELVGVAEKLKVTSSTVGFARDEPYINIVDYGTGHSGPSLLGQSVAPRRGLLGSVLTVNDLDALRERAGDCLGGEAGIELAPFGQVRAAVLTPPHGIPHLVLQTV